MMLTRSDKTKASNRRVCQVLGLAHPYQAGVEDGAGRRGMAGAPRDGVHQGDQVHQPGSVELGRLPRDSFAGGRRQLQQGAVGAANAPVALAARALGELGQILRRIDAQGVHAAVAEAGQ